MINLKLLKDVAQRGKFEINVNMARYYLAKHFFQDRWLVLCSFCLVCDLWLTAAFIKGLVRHAETIANE